MGVTFDQVRFKQAHSNKKLKMKMLKYILPLMLIAVTTTSAFSPGSLFHSEDNAEFEALDEAEDFVEEEEQEEEFDEEEDEDEEDEEEDEDEEDYEEDEEEEDYEEDEEEEDFYDE